ncbi:MAG: hypothetical protein HXX14_11510 [Bacteroidetes bacterium]|nr:hypothetical protein [Bacteroidota bacterium]
MSIFIYGLMPVYAQEYSPYYTNPQYQQYLNYLINSGRINLSHPLSQPYQVNELLDCLLTDQNDNDSYFTRLLNKDLKKLSSTENSLNEYGKLIASTDGSYGYNSNESKRTYYTANASLDYLYKNFGMRYKYALDERYKDNTVYFGAMGKFETKVEGRATEAYLQWQGTNIQLFMGRMNRNFGIMGDPGLLISDNPFSYDHLAFIFHNRPLKYTAIFGRLNDIYGYDIRDSVPQYNWNTRFLSIHRFELRITKKLEVAFTESMLFGGKDQYPLFQYLNPANIFFFSKMSDRKGYQEASANDLMSFEFQYKPFHKLTLFSQFLLDDMDFTKRLRAIYPDRIGLKARIIYADPVPGSQVSLTYNKISNWTYNSFYTWGNYTFYGQSLGYPMNGVESLSLDIDAFNLSPFMLNFRFKAEQYRQQDLDAPYLAIKTKFPIGIPQQGISAKLKTIWVPKSYYMADLEMEYISFNNYNNIKGVNKSFLNVMLNAKFIGVFELFKK